MSEEIDLLKELADENKWEKNGNGYWVYSGTYPPAIIDQAIALLEKEPRISEQEKMDMHTIGDLLEQIKNLEAENEQLEKHLTKTKEAFIDNNKTAYNDGFSQGRSYQAICEIRGRERFLDELQAENKRYSAAVGLALTLEDVESIKNILQPLQALNKAADQTGGKDGTD